MVHEAPPQTLLRNDLYCRVLGYEKVWHRQTHLYAGCSIVFRLLLIPATAIVAAREGVQGFEYLRRLFPLLPILVAILTALDSWLKPREKWQGFMKVREDAKSIVDEIRETSDDDKATLQNLRTRFEALLEYHRQHNVY
jgi:hypothetical protein